MSKLIMLLTLILTNTSVLRAQEDVLKVQHEVYRYQQVVAQMSHFELAEALNLNAASMIYRCGKDFFFGLYQGIRSQSLSLSDYQDYLRQARSRNDLCLIATLHFKVVTDEIRTRNAEAAAQITSDATASASQLADNTQNAAIKMAVEANQATADFAKESAKTTQEIAKEGWEGFKKWSQSLITPPEDEAGHTSNK